MRNRDLAFLVLTLLASIAAALLVAHSAWGVPGEWQWQHRQAGALADMRWWMATAPALALIAFSLWLLRRARAGRRVSGAWSLVFVLLAFALQLSTLAMAPASTAYAGAVILSPVATTHFGEAGKVGNMREFLGDYADRMRTFSQHAQTYPPGPIVLFWAVRGAVERSPVVFGLGAGLITAVTGLGIPDIAGRYARVSGHSVAPPEAVAAIIAAWLLGILGCLSIIPIYLLARGRWGGAAAICAAALAAAVPSLILFTPSILQLVALETALTLYLFDLAWSRRSAWWAAAAGAMWAVSALTSLAMLAVPPLLVVWGIAMHFATPRDQQPPGPAWRVICPWIVASLAVFGLAYLLAGIDFPAIMKSALAAHREVTTRSFARTYSRWLGWNLFDFWMFLGAALGLWLLRQMWADIASALRGDMAAVTPLLWAVALTIAALDISGVVRAEVGRIWMFLMLPAAAAMGRFVASRPQPEMTLGVILAAQLLQISAFERHLALLVVW